MSDHLAELARQVREHTISLLRSTPPKWLLWAPAGTSNHILWHAGHALWLQDALGIQQITGGSELPAGWAESFGSDCRPVGETRDWPDRDEVAALLLDQLIRLFAVFETHSDRLAIPEVTARVIHGLHDEARHQGEMYLLLKLRRIQKG
jgi:hypothetical protein